LGVLGSTLFLLGPAMPSANLPPLPLSTEKWNDLATSLRLSPQQTRIVELILRNCCDKEIAAEMNLKVPTVRTHLGRLFERLKIEDRGALVLMLFAASHQTKTAAERH
jgi:DNA-binding NarL/FixJ family response regulator